MATLGQIETTLWASADKLRGHLDASEYKHVVLGLVFLKYIPDAFHVRYDALADEETSDAGVDPEDRDEYTAEGVFWVPPDARWAALKAKSKDPSIGTRIDEAMLALERENATLEDVLPKGFARPTLDKRRLGEIVDLISDVGFGGTTGGPDVLGKTEAIERARAEDASVFVAGEWHTHPSYTPSPSDVDHRGMQQFVRRGLYGCRSPVLLILGEGLGPGAPWSATVYRQWHAPQPLVHVW